MIDELNRRYDKLKEPYRFIVAMLIIVPGITISYIPGYELLGMCYLVVLLALRLMRTR